MLRESQPRSEIINFLNQKSHINGFSPLLAKVSSRIDPMVRTKHFTAYMRIPSHCYTKSRIHTCEPSFPAHLKLDLVRTAGFTLLPGQVHVSPTAAWDLNCLPSACSLADFSNSLVRLLVFPSRQPRLSVTFGIKKRVAFSDAYAVKSPLSDGILTCFQLRFIPAFLYPFSGR